MTMAHTDPNILLPRMDYPVTVMATRADAPGSMRFVGEADSPAAVQALIAMTTATQGSRAWDVDARGRIVITERERV